MFQIWNKHAWFEPVPDLELCPDWWLTVAGIVVIIVANLYEFWNTFLTKQWCSSVSHLYCHPYHISCEILLSIICFTVLFSWSYVKGSAAPGRAVLQFSIETCEWVLSLYQRECSMCIVIIILYFMKYNFWFFFKDIKSKRCYGIHCINIMAITTFNDLYYGQQLATQYSRVTLRKTYGDISPRLNELAIYIPLTLTVKTHSKVHSFSFVTRVTALNKHFTGELNSVK